MLIYALCACHDKPVRQDPPPQAALQHLQLGAQYQREKKIDQAVQELQTAEGIAPNSWTVKMALGRVYKEKGWYDRAISTFEKAFDLNDKNAEPKNEIGICFAAKGRETTDEALAAFQEAKELAPKYAEPWFNAGCVYMGLEKVEEAKENFEECLKRNPNHAQAHLNLGLLDLRNGFYDGAIQHFQATLTLSPDLPLARYNLGMTYLQQHRYERAVDEFKKAIAKEPRFVQAHVSLGDTYHSMNRIEAARAEFKAALKLDRDNEYCKEKIRELEEASKGGGKSLTD